MILVFVEPSPVVESRMDLMISSLLRYFTGFLFGKNQFLLPKRVAYYHCYNSQVWNSNLRNDIFWNKIPHVRIICIF
jgi:hypothetical protein